MTDAFRTDTDHPHVSYRLYEDNDGCVSILAAAWTGPVVIERDQRGVAVRLVDTATGTVILNSVASVRQPSHGRTISEIRGSSEDGSSVWFESLGPIPLRDRVS